MMQLIYFSVRKERQKVERYVEGTIPMYYLDDFKRCFRMTRATFEVICENLGQFQELLPSWTEGRDHVTIEKQLLITLWYIATQDTTHNIADRFNVTESSVVRCRDRVFSVFLTHLKQQFIIWPTNNIRQEVVDAFRRKANFPDVLGAIDGTHIKIRAPKENTDVHIHRKGYHSIVLQGVCREDLRFTQVLAGWPGSCHDARVLRNSYLWENGIHLCGNGHLLGDGAYPLRTWLITPYRDNGHLTPQKRAFNQALFYKGNSGSSLWVVKRSFL